MKKIYGSIKITLNGGVITVDTGFYHYIMSREEAEPIISKLKVNDLNNLIVDGEIEIAVLLDRAKNIISYLEQIDLVAE
jgi:hypothetical protein